MHFFTFLGTGNYTPCQYHYEHRSIDTTSPAVTFVQTATALLHATEIKRITVFTTTQAHKKHAENLRKEFLVHEISITPEFVQIPGGFNQQEMAEFFTILKDNLHISRHFLVDITHGFRSQPALGLLILNYLQAVNPDTTVEDIVYGAWVKDQPIVPLISLLDLWELNQWAAGFQLFERSGDITMLSDLARKTQEEHMRALKGNFIGPPPQLLNFANDLEAWHHDVKLCAIPQIFAPKSSLKNLLYQLETDWSETSEDLGRLVMPLCEKMREILEPMQAERWDDLDGLRAQLNLMQWLRSHGYYQQVLTLAREWIVTVLALVLDKQGPENRKECDSLCGAISRDNIPHKYKNIEWLHLTFKQTAAQVLDARNRINHSWMRTSKNPEENLPDVVKTIHNKIDEILNNLQKKSWRIAPIQMFSKA